MAIIKASFPGGLVVPAGEITQVMKDLFKSHADAFKELTPGFYNLHMPRKINKCEYRLFVDEGGKATYHIVPSVNGRVAVGRERSGMAIVESESSETQRYSIPGDMGIIVVGKKLLSETPTIYHAVKYVPS